ncbi:motility associated factor glycosyltransferase family protein [Endozoicomonas sp. G2_1]|uniref:motility associated factor glycosyltransferase family protein n=1 Tax=Endozoicomonas sp. G2_1 TaxID=2821091 RepID=UPI001ADA5E2E|nr:6-hydroxymethylpterin diphosphokinase MptE-like protein [Endozoicomonas sp. G2_1]MBO9489061.1 motility associated factor glycosyltransferase family protein [Endozoicomonas sp. G2_1]
MSPAELNLSLNERIAQLEKKAEKIKSQIFNQSQDEYTLQKLADNCCLLGGTDEILLSQYERNMEAFKRFDSNVYEHYLNFTPKRFFVDIFDGFPNVYDSELDTHLYSYPPYLMAMAQVNAYQEHPQSTSAIFDANKENPGNFIHSIYLNKILDVLNNRMKQTDKLNISSKLRKNLSSMMIFGVGAGHHIELLMSQHDVTHLYVIEPDLDIFYSSLFTMDWAGILQKIESKGFFLHLSLGEQKDEFFDDLLNKSYQYGRYDIAKTYGYVHYNTPAITELLKQHKQRFYETVQGWGFFDDSVMSIGHMLTSLQNKVPLLKKKKLQKNELAEYPVFIIGNGPSLDNLVETLKKHKDHAILISCGSALSALYQYGITPDIHCEQERTFPVVEKLSYYCPKSELDKMAFIGPTTIHPEIFNEFNSNLMAIKGQEPSAALLMETALGKELFDVHKYINPTVANTVLSIVNGLGFKNIYFAGVDLAHKLDGNHHSTKSLYYNQDGDDLDLYGYKSLSTIPVEGNFGGEFTTEPFFNASKQGLERLIKDSEELYCYNLSDGAKIKGCQPLKAEALEITLPKLLDKQLQISELFTKASYVDDGTLALELIELLDFDGYEQLCHLMINTIQEKFANTEQCLHFLKRQTQILYDSDTCRYDHFYFLLKGSVMHMQAMLVRVLYEAFDEKVAMDDFNEAVSYYKSFLLHSIEYYRENAIEPHYCGSEWFKPLTKFES